MALETYFDFDSETFQITERKRFGSSSSESPLTPGLSFSSYVKSSCSEDGGFETSSDRSSQDGFPFVESPRSPCFRTSVLPCSTCPGASLDSLASRPLRRFESRESINSTSSFWESSFPPETKAILSKIRDQMKFSLEKVRKLEEQVKQIPLLQVKISTLQEEKRQLMVNLDSRNNFKRSRSRNSSSSQSRSSSNDDLFYSIEDKDLRTIGVGEDTVYDILCEKCKEVQSKLLKLTFCTNVTGYHNDAPEKRRARKPKSEDDEIKVFQDRCTQTRTAEPSRQRTRHVSTCTENADNSSVLSEHHKKMTQESSCDPILVETRSLGVGQIKFFLRDACVGSDRAIPSFADSSVQSVVSTSNKSCGMQILTEEIGVSVLPNVVSIGTGCDVTERVGITGKRSVGSQTMDKSTNLVSVGVGMFLVDNSEDYECSKRNSTTCSSIDELLASNKNTDEENESICVGAVPWDGLERLIVPDYCASKLTASVAVETKVDSCSVGCGEHSVTDVGCLNCSHKITRSLGVGCSPRMSDKAVGDVAPEICSVAVGECCVSDNYCERCFSLQTRTIGVGCGSIFDKVQTELTTTPTTLRGESLEPLSPPQTPNTTNEAEIDRSSVEVPFPVSRMFSDAYEGVESERITDDPDFSDGKIRKGYNSYRDDILSTCKLLQRHFVSNDENLDEDKLLLCLKDIEEYWFTYVTDERLAKESLADFIHILDLHLPYLLDGIINSQDEHGNTALHYLVTYGKFDCVNELLKTNHCNVIITNKAGYSAVMLGSLKEAVNPKDKVGLKRLFGQGNLNCIAQSTGQTALMLAAGTGNVDTVDLLLKCGATESINTTDLDGSTALMCACEHGYANIVKKLLQVDGCDASIADHDGSTCFSIAMEHNRKDIALMIMNYIQLQKSKTPNKKKEEKMMK